MDYSKMKSSIDRAILKSPLDVAAYDDKFALCRDYEGTEFRLAHEWNQALQEEIRAGLKLAVDTRDFKTAEEFDNLLFRSLLFCAPHYFDAYLQTVEYGKPLDKKFYLPRRHYLRRYVEGYQEVLEGKLDFLSISMPKRCGKSQLGINFTNMLSGKFPDRSTLMEGTGDDLVQSFYKGCLEYIQQPNDYHFYAAAYNVCVFSPIIAQAILESNKGTSELAVNAHNYFGLKYRKGRCKTCVGIYHKVGSEQNPDGTYTSSAMEWCKFGSMEDGVIGYFDFTNISAYSNLKGVTDPRQYLENIKADGYATSLKYVDNLNAVYPAESKPAFSPYRVKVTASVLNIRKGAGTNYALAGTIRNGGIYTIVQESTGQGATKWGKLKSGAGWISLDYTTKVS